MKRLFLLILALGLLYAWSFALADMAPSTSISAEKAVKVKVPRAETPAPVQQVKKPVILTPVAYDETELMARPEKQIYSGPANVPDQNVILQGGDNIGSATVIAALPYLDEGTTAGYTNDYDEACPNASTSPDVVYRYTPSGNMLVDVYAYGRTPDWAYDTKLFVYENSYTPGSPFACNDDFFYYYQAALQDLALTGGNTYYIVIDGYGGAFGNYTFEMLASPPRPVGNFCADAENNNLVNGVTYTYVNDSRYALDTDTWFDGPEVFIAFTLPFTMDVTLDMCGSICTATGHADPRWGIGWLNSGIGCPLTSNTAGATPYDRDSCVPDDNNITMTWAGLTAGTYYYPVFSLPIVASSGRCCWSEFTVHVVGYGCPEDKITVEVMTDSYPEETTWEVWDVLNNVLVGSGGPYTGYPLTLFTENVCVAAGGCYEFRIFDAFGDGICCAYGDGYYNVYYNGALIATGGQFGLEEIVPGLGTGCIGACCVAGNCVATNLHDECNALGGEWFLGEDCATYVCPAPSLGACCHDGTCDNLTYGECTLLGGYWHPDDNCTSYTCLNVLYHEDFNSGMGDWYSAPSWDVTSGHSHTPPSCMTDSPTGNYANNETNPVELMIDVPLTGFVGYSIEFYTMFELETGFDYVYLDISTDGGASWDPLAVFNGEAPADYLWHPFTADISGYFDQSVRFKFTLISDGGYVVDGMYVDDFYVYGLTVDASPPLILHTGPTPETSVPGDFEVVATIVDPSGIASATVTYSVDGGPGTTIGPDNVVGDVYTFIIPQQAAGAHVEYYITAEDNSGNSGSTGIQHYVSGTILMYDDNNPEYIYQYAAGDKVATRFTPPQEATLVTGMLRLYTDINRPLDFVDVEVWSNDINNYPDQTLAGPFEVYPQSDLDHPQGWTYVDFRGQGLTFSANEDFHLGYTYRSEWPVILGDSPAVTGRSSSYVVPGPWGQAGTDYHIRVVVDMQGSVCGPYVVGDYNGNGAFNLADIIWGYGKLKGQNNPPGLLCECPAGSGNSWAVAGDVNASCAFNLADIIWGYGKLKGQPNVLNPCPDCPPGAPAPRDGDKPLVVPDLKSKVKIDTSHGTE